MNPTQTDEAKALEKIDLLAGWHWHFDGVKDAKTVILRKPDGTGGCAVTWVHVAEEMAKAFQDELSTLRTQLAERDTHIAASNAALTIAGKALYAASIAIPSEDAEAAIVYEARASVEAVLATRQPTQDKGDE